MRTWKAAFCEAIQENPKLSATVAFGVASLCCSQSAIRAAKRNAFVGGLDRGSASSRLSRAHPNIAAETANANP
jgi:hypothetical protein